MHGMSVEIRLKDYLDNSVNPKRIKKGLKPLIFKQFLKEAEEEQKKYKAPKNIKSQRHG